MLDTDRLWDSELPMPPDPGFLLRNSLSLTLFSPHARRHFSFTVFKMFSSVFSLQKGYYDVSHTLLGVYLVGNLLLLLGVWVFSSRPSPAPPGDLLV